MDLQKDFDGVRRKVFEWAMRKKGISEVLVRSVISLYEGVETRVRVDSELLEEFFGYIGDAPRICVVTFLFALVVDVVTEVNRLR